MYFSPLPSSADDDLLALARLAAAELAPVAGGALLRVHETSPGTEALAWRPLRDEHPLDLLLGFVAPPTWRAIGVCTTGRAHRPQGSDSVSVTLLVDRSGAAASLLHHDDGDDEVLPGRPEGVVPDACRRALALPTTPPPRSSLGLWTASWLDRVVATAAAREPGQPALSWGSVARLHPAGTSSAGPVALALAAAALAEAWPWHRLRAEPAVTDLPGRVPSPDLAGWMDDGMWARWVADALPPVDDLLSATRALLSPVVADAIELVVGAAADAAGWSSGGASEDDDR